MGDLESRMLPPGQIVQSYKIVTRVGVGTFADVYKAVDTSTKKTIALKRFKETRFDFEDVLIEIESLKKAAHKNVTQYIKSFNDENAMYLVMEYCEFGTIDEFIKAKRPDDERRLGFIKDIAAGIAHLHSLKIVHRDLKPANILIGSKYVAKLTDFGLAKILSKTERGAKKMEEIYMSTMAGTPVYMAPEVLDGHYNAQADIFSMGIVFCSVLDDQLKENVEKELIGLKYHMVQDYQYTVPATPIGKFMQRLITGMLQKDYHMRPKAHEISTQLIQYGKRPGKVDLKSIKLLAAGISSYLGVVVLTPSEASSLRKKGTKIKKITVHDLFHLTNPNVLNGPQTTGRDVTNADGTMVVHNIDVMFKSIGGSSGKIKLSKNASLAEMRRRLASESGIQEDLLEVLYKSWPVGDDQSIEMQGIGQGSVVHVHAVNEREKGMVVYEIDGALLDSQFNYDFTNIDDGNTRFIRGGYVYHRPCGWFRHALKVKGQYENDTWLGNIGTRTDSTPNEWPVSYHGSMMTSDNIPIGAASAGVNGIVTTPSLPLVADKFIKNFEFEGNTYQIAFQNRINPDKANGHMVILSDDYWLSPKEDPFKGNYDVRPYGILIRKIDD